MSGAPANIRVTAAEDPRLPRTLRGRLERRRAELMGQLVYAADWADYQFRVGRIAGFDEAILACQEIEKNLFGES